jgi:nucleotide-binding universal stress UspA family protein
MERILIATDFSPAAENAIRYGADIAKFLNAGIILVNAFSMPLGGYDVMAPLATIAEMESSGLAALREEKNKIIKRVGYDPGIDCVCEPGSVFGVISDCATKMGVDLVIMGMVGQAGALKQKVIGSSALSAARNLQLPLIIVPERTTYSKISKIAFAFAEQADPHMLFHSVRAFAILFGAPVELIQVEPENSDNVRSVELSAEKVLESVHYTSVKLRNNNPGDALEAYFRLNKPDLVILNPKKHRLFHDLFASGVTSQLAYHLGIPLLAIH